MVYNNIFQRREGYVVTFLSDRGGSRCSNIHLTVNNNIFQRREGYVVTFLSG